MENREKLLQEEYIDTEWGPWKVLVICQCLNQTTWKQAEPALKKIFDRWPNPEALAAVGETGHGTERLDLQAILKPLGLLDQRFRRLISMSDGFRKLYAILGDEWNKYDINLFPGCGRYAFDAWRLFVLKKPTVPLDERLKQYAQEKGMYENCTFHNSREKCIGSGWKRKTVSKLCDGEKKP